MILKFIPYLEDILLSDDFSTFPCEFNYACLYY